MNFKGFSVGRHDSQVGAVCINTATLFNANIIRIIAKEAGMVESDSGRKRQALLKLQAAFKVLSRLGPPDADDGQRASHAVISPVYDLRRETADLLDSCIVGTRSDRSLMLLLFL